MCGIFGSINANISESAANTMADKLSHRGPDGRGVFLSSDKKVCLGQTRLAIIDLSDGGKQPMHAEKEHHKRDGIAVVFNGEIYNYQAIREELLAKGYRLKSTSDTEVLLAGYIEWGMDVVHRFRGMFAFTIWDEHAQKLFLCRDRFGVKPLYYWIHGNTCIFASELKPLLTLPNIRCEIDGAALQNYLTFGYIPAPHTIYQGIYKLLPGTIMTVSVDGQRHEERYWTPSANSKEAYAYSTEKEWLDALEEKLSESFSYRMVADVPVGVFLSGGIDSSLVAALLQKGSRDKLKTFTLGFTEKQYDESVHAKKIADVLGTDHHELVVSSNDIQSVLEKYGQLFDEPFGDSSALVTYVLAQFARQKVKVALSGDGGDELFYGYSKYEGVRKAADVHPIGRQLVHGLIETVGPARAASVYEHLARVLPLPRFSNLREKLSKLSYTLTQKTAADMFYAGGTYWRQNEIEALLVVRSPVIADHQLIADVSLEEAMQLADMNQYLPDDILVKTDRTTMAVGLEAREPYLDQTVWNFVRAMPASIRYKNPGTKYPLRQILSRHVSQELFERPKTGFRVPMYEWLKGDSRHLIDTYLSPSCIKQQGIFDPDTVQKIIHTWNISYFNPDKIWLLIAFQLWYEEWYKKK